MRMTEEKGLWNMSKHISVVSIVVLMLILSISSAIASSTSVSIDSADTRVGESVTLSLMIENAAEEISCATIVLSYNNAIAQVTSVNNSDFNVTVYNPDNTQGKTTIVVYQTSAEGLTGSIKIADVTIEAIGVGSSPLDLEIETLKNNVGTTVSADVISGSFTVKSSSGNSGGNGGSGGSTPTPTPSPSPSPTPSPTPSANETITPSPSVSPSPSQPEEPGIVTVQVGDVTVGKGEFANITITIKGVGGEGLSSALINLTYDSNIVKVVSAGNSDFDMFIPNVVDGKVRMIGFQTGAEGLKEEIKFAELRVEAAGKANESSELKLEVKELTDNEGFPVHFEVKNGFFLIKGEGKAVPEPSKPIIPTLSVFETIAVIVGSYFVIKIRRRK